MSSNLCQLTMWSESLTLPPASKPVDTIFAEIDDLVAMAKIIEALMISTQKINMTYILFLKTTCLQVGIENK